MNSDFKELLDALNEAEVEYLIVGAYAVIYHSRPRFTKDLDIRLRADPVNARNLMRAFRKFGMPLILWETSTLIAVTKIESSTQLKTLFFRIWGKRI